ncbi:MAG TPA: LytTR family DNA-binding domain-containing protein [Ignavibacteriaceae bacterium]|nr:LytTR family DNA-binding domain-containing protein [Ignavibacteriaceae bacterium]
MESISTLIVDDENYSRENLSTLIRNYCPELQVVGKADSARSAKELIEKLEPDVLFLDINMPSENGFDLLDSITERNFCVVFATAHDEYGIQAVKADAVDYILKPFDVDELKRTTKKIVEKISQLKWKEKRGDKPAPRAEKIIINHYQGFSIVNIEDIIRIEADSNYSKIHVLNAPFIITSKTLKDFAGLLDKDLFYRIHKSHLINLKYLREYSGLDGGYAVMSDNSKIMISRRRYQEFIDKLKNFTLYIK